MFTRKLIVQLVTILSIVLFGCTSKETPIISTETSSPTDTPTPIPTEMPLPSETTSPTLIPVVSDVLLIFAGYDFSGKVFNLLGGYQDGNWLLPEQASSYVDINKEIRYFTLAGENNLVQITSLNYMPNDAISQCTRERYEAPLAIEVPTNAVAINNTAQGIQVDVQSLSPDNKIYKQELVDYLKSQAISDPDPQIQKILLTDLDGDGTKEVIIEASRFVETSGHNVSPGDYSLIFLRRVVGNEVLIQRVIGDVYTQATENAVPPTYSVQAILDANEDGRSELFVYRNIWEGDGTILFELQENEFVEVLQLICF